MTKVFNSNMELEDAFKAEVQQRNHICSHSKTMMLSWSQQRLLKVFKIEAPEKRDVYMHMLLHLNEDFDDDLLLECIQALEEEDQ